MKHITIILLSALTVLMAACDDPEQSVSEEDQTFRLCTPDWELVEAAKIPCHMDVDTHTFYREIEAWGVDVYIDGNTCFAGNRYHKVQLGDKKCYYGVNQTQNCAAQLYLNLTNNYMPLSVYDNDTCPHPRLWENQGGGGGGQPPGGQQQQ